jgi:hypothetical protein
MENKLNYTAIEAYTKQYSARLIDSLYEYKEHVSGDDILKLPVKQVGLFILQEIYTKWAKEADRLKSPYFNYENSDVKAALEKMMNTLSKNILVDKETFLPLLENAVYQSLILIFSPYSYFKNLIIDQNISFGEFNSLLKFIVINKAAASALNEKMQTASEDSNRNELINEVFLSLASPESSSEHVDAFSELETINENKFYITLGTPVVDEDEDEEDQLAAVDTLNDRFSGARYETLADKLKTEQSGSVESLKSMLSINQKFMFINDLFKDSQDDFNKVMDFLESCESREAARSFIDNNYLKHNIWNPNAPQVKEFLALIDKKFN